MSWFKALAEAAARIFRNREEIVSIGEDVFSILGIDGGKKYPCIRCGLRDGVEYVQVKENGKTVIHARCPRCDAK